MTFDEYQKATAETAIYPQRLRIVYPLIGLDGETGEVAEKVKKTIRDNDGIFNEDEKREIAKELGDVLWYLAAIARDMGYRLDDIAQINLDKIALRNERNKIHGHGDNR